MAFSCNSLQLNDHIILNVSARGNNIVTVLLERLLFPHENGTPIELRTLRFIFVFGLTNLPQFGVIFLVLHYYLPDRGREQFASICNQSIS